MAEISWPQTDDDALAGSTLERWDGSTAGDGTGFISICGALFLGNDAGCRCVRRPVHIGKHIWDSRWELRKLLEPSAKPQVKTHGAAKCPTCSTGGCYNSGFTVECINPECRFYKEI